MNRRKFVILSGAAVAGTYGAMKLQRPPKLPNGPAGNSGVAIIRAKSYSDDLVARMLEGIRECGLDARGKRVLLKPNLVEFDSATVINTDASVIAAAVEVFERLGAAEVKIGEGPGHRRDTLDLADDARYRATVPRFERIFTDLNRDDVSPIQNFAGESRLLLSQYSAGGRPDRLARQDENPPLGGRNPLNEELLRDRPRLGVRLA